MSGDNENKGDMAGKKTIEELESLTDIQKGILIGMGFDMERLEGMTLEELMEIEKISDNAQALYDELHSGDEDKEEGDEGDKEEEKEEEPPTEEEMIALLKELPEVSATVAKRMYDSGITTVKALEDATEEDLMKIEGITRATARRILSSVHLLKEKDTEKEPSEEQAGKEEQKGGFISAIINRIKRFLFKEEVTSDKVEGETTEDKAEETPEEESPAEGDSDTQETEPSEEPAGGEEKSDEDTGKEANDSEGEEDTAAVAEVNADPAVVEEFMKIEGMTEEYAKALAAAGYSKLDELKMVEKEDLELVEGIGKEKAGEIFEIIQKHFKE